MFQNIFGGKNHNLPVCKLVFFVALQIAGEITYVIGKRLVMLTK